jgi:hypothetical protein
MAAATARRALQTVEGREWSVAVIAARESPETLCGVIDAALEASRRHRTALDILINGNQDLSRVGASFIASKQGMRGGTVVTRIWEIAFRDKAHALNEYVHRIWPGSDIAFFLDGYARVEPDAFEQMASSLAARPDALGAGAGKSVYEIHPRGPGPAGITGNFNALRGGTMTEFRRREIRLPIGFYWVDGLTGAILSFDFDPAAHPWNTDNIVMALGAHCVTVRKSPWRLSDLRDHLNRMQRQARGRFENRAVREHLAVNRKSPREFPETAREMVVTWIRQHPMAAAWLALRNPLVAGSLLKLSQRQDLSNKNRPPVLVATTEI